MKIYVKNFKATFRNAPPSSQHNINKIHVTLNVICGTFMCNNL